MVMDASQCHHAQRVQGHLKSLSTFWGGAVHTPVRHEEHQVHLPGEGKKDRKTDGTVVLRPSEMCSSSHWIYLVRGTSALPESHHTLPRMSLPTDGSSVWQRLEPAEESPPGRQRWPCLSSVLPESSLHWTPKQVDCSATDKYWLLSLLPNLIEAAQDSCSGPSVKQ